MPYWEYIRLFATVLEGELDCRATLRREIEHRLVSGTATFVNILELGEWAQDRLRECRRFGDTASAILNDYLPQALGEDGVSGDPSELAAVARRLAQLWEDSARWTLRCRAVRVDEPAERLVDLLSNTNANMLDEIWEYGHTLLPRLNEAIEAAATGDPSHVDLTLTLTADLDEFNEELARLERELLG